MKCAGCVLVVFMTNLLYLYRSGDRYLPTYNLFSPDLGSSPFRLRWRLRNPPPLGRSGYGQWSGDSRIESLESFIGLGRLPVRTLRLTNLSLSRSPSPDPFLSLPQTSPERLPPHPILSLFQISSPTVTSVSTAIPRLRPPSRSLKRGYLSMATSERSARMPSEDSRQEVGYSTQSPTTITR